MKQNLFVYLVYAAGSVLAGVITVAFMLGIAPTEVRPCAESPCQEQSCESDRQCHPDCVCKEGTCQPPIEE